MVEIALALAVTLAPAASGIGRAGAELLARVTANVAAPLPVAACKPERSAGRGWIGTPPRITGYRTW